MLEYVVAKDRVEGPGYLAKGGKGIADLDLVVSLSGDRRRSRHDLDAAYPSGSGDTEGRRRAALAASDIEHAAQRRQELRDHFVAPRAVVPGGLLA